jgi:hypothetical protein
MERPATSEREPLAIPLRESWRDWALRHYLRFERSVVGYFTTHEPTLKHAILPLMLLAWVLYIRHPSTNYIFDEQEALLANPYVNAAQKLEFWDVIHRDFWGLPPDASIGSYRPLPNVLWRLTWTLTKHPFYHHLYNLALHGLNGALLTSFAWALTRRRALAWLVGAVFVCAAIITEAVSGIVGLADVLGGLGAAIALMSLRAPAPLMPFGVFAGVTVGLFSKESALVCVPLLPVAALLTAPFLHPQRPARLIRTLLALVASLGAFVLYVELRTEWFPSPLPSELTEPLPADAGDLQILHRDFMVWFRQAPLPKDPLNNPLADADFPHRVAGALRVYWRGCVQVLLPLSLSGDYSFPQEPIPESLYGWETVAGAGMIVGPLLAALVLWLVAGWRESRDKRHLVPAGELADRMAALGSAGTTRTPGAEHAPSSAKLAPALLMQAPRPWNRNVIAAGILCIVPAIVGIATEYYLVSERGEPGWVKTWPYSLALLCVGIGLLVEGWVAQPRPMVPAGPWPWRHVAPPLIALGLVWLVVSYFPHSNIPVVLPTVRAERFWYFPVIGTTFIIAVVLAYWADRMRGRMWKKLYLAPFVPAVFITMQAFLAYRHSMDYQNDLLFWKATKDAVPFSSKAHLNYSVMVGARGDLETRLVESEIAMQLAPKWAMAAIYTGDTLCRMHRPHEAWPHYARGFGLGPNDRSLIALALQCMYDENILVTYDAELRRLAEENPDSWVRYLAYDTLDNHEKYKGVNPQYRPRGYNEGPKEDKTEEASSSAETDASATDSYDFFEPNASPEDSSSAVESSSASTRSTGAQSTARWPSPRPSAVTTVTSSR